MTASYLSDALRKLILAATAVATGFNRVSFGFDEEPGEYRWLIDSPRLNEIEVRILSFPELWGGAPDADGKELFRATCLPEQFAQAVHRAAAVVLLKHGEEDYAARWNEHPFPKGQFEELSRVLEELP